MLYLWNFGENPLVVEANLSEFDEIRQKVKGK